MHQKIQFLILLLVCTGLFGSAKAQNYVTIPDPNFLSALQEILPAEVFNEAGEMNADHEAVLNCWELDVSNRGIQSLDGIQYFVYLGVLNCGVNRLTDLPFLSHSLERFACDYNQLTWLPDLPPNLWEFSCNHNQLTWLPDLPGRLEWFESSYNNLTDLPELPQSLKFLFCSNNQLRKLPSLPEGLLSLGSSYNNLIE